MADLFIIETGNGGDIVLVGNDFVTVEGLSNMPYLGMFGGNIEASTIQNQNQNSIATEQQYDWWGNSILMFNQPEIQFNSTLEKTLKSIAITSSSRETIKRAVIEDLAFISVFADVSVSVSIAGLDRISILIKIQEPQSLESNEFTYIWNATNAELTSGATSGDGIALNNILNLGL
jgi:hypothetical protein